jgi:LmbE family N-acetylglucosaminyl deacetylase
VVVAAGDDAWRSLCARADTSPLSSGGNWLVLAPHPDDETLGAGGLLATLAEKGIATWVAYLTWGEASHRGAPRWPSHRIARTRRAEAWCALRELGQTERRPIFLGWRDGAPPPIDGASFRRSSAELLELCKRHEIRNIATTWRGEGHCDHRAAYDLGRTVISRSDGKITLFEYLVWGWTDPSLIEKVRTLHVAAPDTGSYAERCQAAIACHRTQVSSLICGAREAFRLAPEMVAVACRSPFILLSEGQQNAA